MQTVLDVLFAGFQIFFLYLNLHSKINLTHILFLQCFSIYFTKYHGNFSRMLTLCFMYSKQQFA
jgi:hypothetical protein